ncbi:ABC transporter ATP-binding protein [Nonomuraea sp. 10N515B]|uniref:ABC transporter ATP-binding protein n=1 Tax=Nonomuraea sp. 10N515B TaxID=3457422 RepID=UPI003FCDE5C8
MSRGKDRPRSAGRRLVGLLRPELRLAGPAALLSLVAMALTATGPLLLGHATDLIVDGVGQGAVDTAALTRQLLFAVGVFAMASVCTWVQLRLTGEVVTRTASRLRARVGAKLDRLPLAYLDSQPRGDLLSRTTNDVDALSQALNQVLGQLLTPLLTVIAVTVMMVGIAPDLAVVVLLTVPASMAVAGAIARRTRPQFKAQAKAMGAVNAYVDEMITGQSLVKVFGRGREVAATFDEYNQTLYTAARRAQLLSGIMTPGMFFIAGLGFIAVAVAGGLKVAAGTLTVGLVQAFIQYAQQFNQPIGQLASMANLIQSGLASAGRVFEFLDAPEERPDPEGDRRPDLSRGRVAFENVSFRYTPDTPVIENLSLTVQPGSTVAIVGPTGAGKSTLVNLLMRFYEVTNGRITLDGIDIATLPRAELRARIGMVLQDPWLFSGTIAANIAYGTGDVPREKVVEAAMATRADHFIRTLPDGYDTIIDEEGSNISAGEKQLITIARAFLGNPSILILDEATSAVDTRTEALIQHGMASLRADRTGFVIAHRLSTIRDADTILVLDSGSIVEHGTHDQLLAAGGAYARLHAAQFTPGRGDDD